MSKKQTTPEQFKSLVEFMVQHPDIGRGVTDLRPEQQTDLWDKITKKLNSMGPPIRDVSSWKKVWRDYKSNTKKKLVVNKQHIEGTGGGPNKISPLSDLEEAVSTLLNFNMSVGGIPNITSFGVEDATPSPSDVTTSLPENNCDYQPKPKYFRKEIKENNATTLLQQQIELQRKFYDDYRSLKREELGYLEIIAEQLKLIAKKD